MIRALCALRKPRALNGMLTVNPQNLGMQVLVKTDPMQAFNERAKAAGWTFTCLPPSGFDHPDLASALALWREKAGRHAMPHRADMTARPMKAYLSHVSIIERVGAGRNARYRVRLHGTAATHYAGDKTGRFLEEFVPDDLVGCYAGVYDTAIELKAPLRVLSSYQVPEIDYLVGETLVAPLSVPGNDAPVILSVTFAEPRAKRMRPRP